MKIAEKTVKVFVASDEKEFLTEKECLDYEENVIARRGKIKYFSVSHSADFTEGRGFYSFSLIAVESDWSHSEMAEMYCQLKFGKRIDWMYHTPAECWRLSQIDKESYFNHKPKNGERVFLSHSDMDGYPKSLHLDGKTKKENL
jgi:hypothetical protein